jgi:predicted CoA-binding protein
MSFENDALEPLLRSVHTIAVVGISDKPERDSHRVAVYLQRAGYKIVPVNPLLTTVLGETCYPSLAEIPETVDLVNVFRRPEEVPAIVAAAIAHGTSALWLQLGVVHPEAAAQARAAGLKVVMDRCIKIEHAALGLPTP